MIDRIDEILPQTQCQRCHFPGCRPYAEAIVSGIADINQCAPGGTTGIRLLATLLGVDPKPLNPRHGTESTAKIARILEVDCIGCAKCIEVCPVDAIVGAQKQMHTVIESECTGCELCLPPCPVDCIELNSVRKSDPRSSGMNVPARQELAARAKMRYEARNLRLTRQKLERDRRNRKKKEQLQKYKLLNRNNF